MFEIKSAASYGFAFMLGALAFGMPLPGAAQSAETSEPIKIALFDWTSVNVNAKIYGGILETLGYTVEYPTADYLSSLTTGLTNGDLTIGMEFWSTVAAGAMAASDATKQTENLGALGPTAKEEWWYPDYMSERCPGLPNWEALKSPACAKAFSTAETGSKGRYLGGPVTWGGFDDERVEALRLPFTVIHAGTEAAMMAELDSAYQRKAPIMVWIYSPNWASLKYKGEWVQFPEYTQACYTDAAWGINKDMKYDCGKPHGAIYKYAWGEMKTKWPLAYKVARNFTMDTDALNKMSGDVDLEGKTIEDVAAKWIADNKAIWQNWIK